MVPRAGLDGWGKSPRRDMIPPTVLPVPSRTNYAIRPTDTTHLLSNAEVMNTWSYVHSSVCLRIDQLFKAKNVFRMPVCVR